MEQAIPKRNQIPEQDKWDLSALFPSSEAWEQAFSELERYIEQAGSFQGTLGDSPQALKSCLDFLNELGMLFERLHSYAFLSYAEDAANSEHQARIAKISQVGARLSAEVSFIEPEILSIPEATMESMLNDPILEPFRIKLNKILRFRPFTLSQEEERILALQADTEDTPSNAFEALTNVDIDFGTVETDEGKRPLSQSTLSEFLQDSNREIRKQAYHQFYQAFDQHKHTLSALYSGSVKQDAYRAQVRGFSSSRAKALYPDQVDETVYDNLIASVKNGLDELHRYYRLKMQTASLDELRHYDVYIPFRSDVRTHYPYEQAVDTICEALSPLGEEYTQTLKNGLLGGWVDKYENRGKRSGAFSAGSYSGAPYILMNYKENVFRDVFTLAHEGGHSMHSWYSTRSNPFQHYSYTIFEAEVASTFNEQLLSDYLLQRSDSPEMTSYIIGKRLDDIAATLFRQTMFAEYEMIIHRQYESGQPLTTDRLRRTYRDLLEGYLAPVTLEEVSDLECLRIPHFYRAFYVYKYATGLSAALSLAKQVSEGGPSERDRYLAFLRSGGSKFPMESLRSAGVDMTSPEPVNEAVGVFSHLLDRMEVLIT